MSNRRLSSEDLMVVIPELAARFANRWGPDKRPYPRGQRNPETLPFVHAKSETAEQNRVGTAAWSSLRKRVSAGVFVGAKYV